MKFTHLFRPEPIVRFCKIVMPFAWFVAFLSLAAGSIWGLFYSPADYQQGESVRIMYVHVPASWWALGVYTFSALISAVGLIGRLPMCFIIAKAFAPIGAAFTVISLMTGSIWGKPTWGAWWVWDARLTSMLILLFLYIGYLNFAHNARQEKTLSAASIFLIIGLVNIPIIKWSVNWWYTLHQPASLMRFDKPAIHHSLLWPLLIMALGFGAYALALGCWRLTNLIREHQRERETLSS